MKKLLTGILAASLAFGAPAMAQNDDEYSYDPETVRWEVKLLDADGNEVNRKARATDAVATVLGPRKYQLSIGCSRGDRTRFIRIQRLVDNEEMAEFSGRVFDPMVEVRYRGETIFTTERGALRWQDEGYYEGRAGNRVTDALKRGARAIFYDEDSDERIAFQLDGSYNAISQVPCE